MKRKKTMTVITAAPLPNAGDGPLMEKIEELRQNRGKNDRGGWSWMKGYQRAIQMDSSLSARHLEWEAVKRGQIPWTQVSNAKDRIALSNFSVDQSVEYMKAEAERTERIEAYAKGQAAPLDEEISGNRTYGEFEWGVDENGLIHTPLTRAQEKYAGATTPLEVIEQYPELAESHFRIMDAIRYGDPTLLNEQEAAYWVILMDKGELHVRLAPEKLSNEDIAHLVRNLRVAAKMDEREAADEQDAVNEREVKDNVLAACALQLKASGTLVDRLTWLDENRDDLSVEQLVAAGKPIEASEKVARDAMHMGGHKLVDDRRRTGWTEQVQEVAEALSDQFHENEIAPYGNAQCFGDYDTWVDAQEDRQKLDDLTWIHGSLMSNILNDDELDFAAKAQKLAGLAGELQSRLKEA
jgi:hypothetical protein